jgi:hypothetical protein
MSDQNKTQKAEARLNEILTSIARNELGMETLEPQNSDTQDFHEVGIWEMKTALKAAYQAGLAANKEAQK